jgi:hypothetical protein
MSTSADSDDLEAIEPQQVLCSDTELTVTLKDGRRITTPLWWYPATVERDPAAAGPLRAVAVRRPLAGDRTRNLSVAGMLRGAKAPGAKEPELV